MKALLMPKLCSGFARSSRYSNYDVRGSGPATRALARRNATIRTKAEAIEGSDWTANVLLEREKKVFQAPLPKKLV